MPFCLDLCPSVFIRGSLLCLAFLRDLCLFISVVKTAFLPWWFGNQNNKAWIPACAGMTTGRCRVFLVAATAALW